MIQKVNFREILPKRYSFGMCCKDGNMVYVFGGHESWAITPMDEFWCFDCMLCVYFCLNICF